MGHEVIQCDKCDKCDKPVMESRGNWECDCGWCFPEKQEKEMSDLEWLARNVSEWPEGGNQSPLECPDIKEPFIWGKLWDGDWLVCSKSSVVCTKHQWKQKREDLGLDRVTLKAGDYVEGVSRSAISAVAKAFEIALRQYEAYGPSQDGSYIISSNSTKNRRLTPTQVLNATNAQPPAQIIKVDDVWSGEGLPPVGVKVERSNRGDGHSSFKEVTIKYIGSEFVVVEFLDGRERAEKLSLLKFRPIKTERDRVIEAAAKALQEHNTDVTELSTDVSRFIGAAAALYEKGLLEGSSE